MCAIVFDIRPCEIVNQSGFAKLLTEVCVFKIVH